MWVALSTGIPRQALKMLNFEANSKTENSSDSFLLQTYLLDGRKSLTPRQSPTFYNQILSEGTPPLQTVPICSSSQNCTSAEIPCFLVFICGDPLPLIGCVDSLHACVIHEWRHDCHPARGAIENRLETFPKSYTRACMKMGTKCMYNYSNYRMATTIT